MNREKLISMAHTNLTRKKGKPQYAPTTKELEDEIQNIALSCLHSETLFKLWKMAQEYNCDDFHSMILNQNKDEH